MSSNEHNQRGSNTGASLQERRRNKKDQSFVGRKPELNSFLELISQRPPQFNIYSLIGVGGIGKTTLLGKYSQEARSRNIQSVLVNCSAIRSTIDIMKEIRKSFSEKSFKKFDKILSKYYEVETAMQSIMNSSGNGGWSSLENVTIHDIPVGAAVTGFIGKERIKAFMGKYFSPQDIDNYSNAMDMLDGSFSEGLNELASTKLLIIFLDTYEETGQEIDEWLTSLLNGDFSENIILVIAGRDALENKSHKWMDWADLTCEQSLEKLDNSEAEEFLRKYGVNNELLIQSIIRFSDGLPWALELTVESLSKEEINTGNITDIPNSPLIGQKIIDRFLRQVNHDQTLRQLLHACSIVPLIDQEIINYLLQGKGNSLTYLQQLKKYSFFKANHEGYYYIHDIVREFIEKDYKTFFYENWLQTNHLMVQYYTGKRNHPIKGSRTDFKYYIEIFRYLTHIDEDKSISLLLEISRHVLTPILYEEIYTAILNITRDNTYKEKNKTVLNFFESQLYILRGNTSKALETLNLITEETTLDIEILLLSYVKRYSLYHRTGEVNEAFNVAIKGYHLALSKKKYNFTAQFCANIGEIYGMQGDLKNSEKYALESLKYLDSLEDKFSASEVHITLAHIYLYKRDCLKGEIELMKAMNNWESLENEYGIAQVNCSLSWLYGLNGSWHLSKIHAQKAYTFFNEIHDYYHIGLTALNLAKPLYLRKEITDAMQWNNLAAERLKESSKLYYAIALKQTGMCYLQSGDYPSAIQQLNNAISIGTDVNEKYTLGDIYYHLALAHDKNGDKETAEKYFDESEKYLTDAQHTYGLNLLWINKVKRHIAAGEIALAKDLIQSRLSTPQPEFPDLNAILEMQRCKLAFLYDRKESVLPHLKKSFTDAIGVNCILLYDLAEEFKIFLTGMPIESHKFYTDDLRDLIIQYWNEDPVDNGQSHAEEEKYNRILEAIPNTTPNLHQILTSII